MKTYKIAISHAQVTGTLEFCKLVKFLGMGEYEAFGRLVAVTCAIVDMRCNSPRVVINHEWIDCFARHDGFANALVLADMARADVRSVTFHMAEELAESAMRVRRANPKLAGERRSITPKRRFAVLSRHGFACVYCGRTPTKHGVALHVDHRIAVASGGENHDENLVAACSECNSGKSDSPLTER